MGLVGRTALNYNKGFTLTEVLITLVIIGVVAVLTVAVINNTAQEAERRSKVKKTWSTLANAITRYKADGGDFFYPVANTVAGMKNFYNNYFNPYLISVKTCHGTAGCWNEGDTKSLNGENAPYNHTGIGVGEGVYTVVLSDGTFLNFDAYSVHFNEYFKVTNKGASLPVVILFDINGAKKPNTVGKDIFAAAFTEEGLFPAYAHATKEEIDADCSSTGRGYSCIQKYLRD